MFYLKNLNESFEKLYNINESASALNEAYGESWPKWLKHGFNSSARNYGVKSLSDGDRYQGAISTKAKARGNEAPKTGFKKDRGDTRSDIVRERDSSLFNLARDAGIDLQHANVTEVPVEDAKKYTSKSKSGDPTKICIWGFPNGQVYVEGLNENEKYAGSPKQLPFSWVSLKNLIEYANHFAYFDATELKPDLYSEKDAERNLTYNEMQKFYKEHPEMLKPDSQEGKQFADIATVYDKRAAGATVDKSGYMIDPARYEEPLNKLRAAVPDKQVKKKLTEVQNAYEKWYQRLLRYWRKIQQTLVFEPSMFDADYTTDITGLMLDSLDESREMYNTSAGALAHIATKLLDDELDEDILNDLSSRLDVLLAIAEERSKFYTDTRNLIDNATTTSVNWLL